MGKTGKKEFKHKSNVHSLPPELKDQNKGKEIALSDSEAKKFKDFDQSINVLKVKHSGIRLQFLFAESDLMKQINGLLVDKNKEINYILGKNKVKIDPNKQRVDIKDNKILITG